MHRFFLIAAALAALFLAGCGGGAQDMRIVSANQTVTVSPTAHNGWDWYYTGAANAEIAAGPGAVPFGSESLHLEVGANGADAAWAGTAIYTGLLSDLRLSYSSYT